MALATNRVPCPRPLDKPAAVGLLGLILAYHRTPLAFPRLGTQPLPAEFPAALAAVGAALTPEPDPELARQWGTTPAELVAATRFFVRHVLLTPDGDYYRWLGVHADADPETLRLHYRLLIRLCHPDRDPTHGYGPSVQLNQAYATLSDPDRRRQYDEGRCPAPLPPSWNEWAAPIQGLALPLRAFQPVRHRRPEVYRVAFGTLALFLISSALILRHLNQSPVSVPSGDPQPPPASQIISSSSLPPVSASVEENKANIAAAPREDRPSSTPPAETGPDLKALTVSPPPEPKPTGQKPAPLVQRAQKAEAQTNQQEPPIVLTKAPSAALGEGAQAEATRETREHSLPAPRQEALGGVAASQRASVALAAQEPPKTSEKAKVKRAEPEELKETKGGQKASAQPQVSAAPPSSESLEKRTALDNPARTLPSPRPLAPPPPPPTAAAQALLERLQAAYANQDASALAELFTPDAQVNEGRGQALIRARYADLFRRANGTALRFQDIEWRVLGPDRIQGQGRVVVRVRYRGESAWQAATARCTLTVVRGPKGDYRFARLQYHPD